MTDDSGIDPRLDSRLEDVVSELSSILGWEREQVAREVAAESVHPGSHVRDAWNEAIPTQPADVESFYSTTDAYILDLMVESERDVRRQWRQAVVDTLETWWGGAAGATVLDYGGGVGTDTLWFARNCRSAFYYDLPGHTSDFATERFNRRGANVTRVVNTNDYSAHFDALVSFEVLEHLLDPIAHLDTMVRLTKSGGMLFLTESFDLVTEDYPSHIPANRIYAGQLDDLMRARGCHPVTLLEGRIHAYIKGPSVTAAVPVYNAYDHVCRLLESIRATTPGYPISWLFVNDASPDPRISELLRSFAATFAGSCRVIDRAENRGFPLTANEAMEAAGTDDVILLNSDTIVYDGWARKLVQAAYSSPRIGTVTPLSNNASAYSVFKRVAVKNTLNQLLGAANPPLVDIPVGVGFCLYIKREMLDRVGYFDPIFGKGYGEETDLCLRAGEAGYRHVLAPSVFVYHAGSASMLEANVIRKGESTIRAHERTIAQRYPMFGPSVHKLISDGVIERLGGDLASRYVTHESSRRPSIAVVVHDDIFSPVIGGTTEHLRDMVRELGSEFVFYFLTPDPDGEDNITVTACVDGVGEAVIADAVDYQQVLAELNPSLIHIHHLMQFSARFVAALTAWSGPKFYTIHDYFGVCEQFTLLNYKRDFCNVPGPVECGKCAHALWGTGYAEVAAHRAIYQRLVDSCTKVLAPSATALAIFRKAITIPDCKAQVIPHPMVFQKYRNAVSDPFRHDAMQLSVAEVADDEYIEEAKRETALKKPSRAQDAHDVKLEVKAGSGRGSAKAAARLAAARTLSAPLPIPSTVTEQKIRDAKLRVGIIGYNAPQKGTALLHGLLTACVHDPILFVSIGDIGKTAAGLPNLIATGQYERQEVVGIIQAQKLDVMIVASLWPETFCYTVSEAWMAGVPVLTGPIGAQAERVRETGAGMTLPDFKVQTFARALRTLTNDQAHLDAMKRATAHVTTDDSYAPYRDTYIASAGGHSGGMTRLFTSVRQEASEAADTAADVPIIKKLVRIRKRLFPVGSLREQFYFWLHNRLTRLYAGNVEH